MSLIDQHQAAWRKFRAEQRVTTVGPPPTVKSRARPSTRTVPKQTANDQLLHIKLEADLLRLAAQPSREARTALQAKLLASDTYANYLAQVLQGQGSTGEDPVLVRCMIWSFNTGNIQQGLALAKPIMQRGLAMPDEFKASAAVFVCREIAYWALAQQKAGNSPQPYLDEVWSWSHQIDKPDQIEARLYKAKGLEYQQTQPQQALELLERAHALDDSVGVSQLIKRLRKQLLE